MCGIAGFFSNDNLNKEQKEEVFDIMSKMFVETQSRGTDASGFSFINKHGKLTTVKGPITAQKMVLEDKFLSLKQDMPKSLMAHCRAMTVGSQLDNFNNHPLIASKKIAVIHNGTISNHRDLKKKHELLPKGAVDSEVIPMLIYKHLEDIKSNNSPIETIKSINMTSKQLDGGFACALLNENNPNTLFLFNHTNPIVMGYCLELDTVFFASTRDIIESSIKSLGTARKFDIFTFAKYRLDYGTIDNDTITVLNLIKNKKGQMEIDINGFELNANAKFQNWNQHTRSYDNSSYEVPAPSTPKIKAIFYGGSKPVTTEKEDWEIARAAGYIGVV